jgi:hypothetical protein
VRESAAGRAEGIDRQVQALARMIGGDVPDKDRAAIAAALRAVSGARGDWFAAGLSWGGTGPTVYARAAVGDEGRLGGALGDLVALAKLPSMKGFLNEEALRVSSGKHVVERLPGDVRRVRFERVEGKENDKTRKEKTKPAGEPEASEALPKSIDLLYLIQDKTLFASAGYDPEEGLRRLVAATGGERLGKVPAFQSALGALGGDTSFALVLDPLRIVASRAGRPATGDPAAAVIAAGASPASGGAPAALWARADVPTAVIRELIRYRGMR